MEIDEFIFNQAQWAQTNFLKEALNGRLCRQLYWGNLLLHLIKEWQWAKNQRPLKGAALICEGNTTPTTKSKEVM